MPYLFIFIITIISFSFLSNKNNSIKVQHENELPFVMILLLVLILFYGLRYDVGIDYMSYYSNAFEGRYDLPQKGTGVLFEPAFRALYRIGDFFELPPNTIFVLGGIIIYSFIYLACFENSENLCLSIFIFFCSGLFFFSFNEFRQFIAVSIIFYGYKYCVKQNIFIWILIVIIAMQFHKSAFVSFPMYFICNHKYQRKTINFVCISSLILKKIGVLPLLCFMISFLPPPFCNYSEVLPYMINKGGSGIIGYIYLLIILYLNNFTENHVNRSKKENFFLNVFIFATIFLNVFSNIYMITRLMEYYLISILVVYPIFYKKSKKTIYRYIFFLFISTVFLTNFFKYAFLSPASNKLEYHTIFNTVIK